MTIKEAESSLKHCALNLAERHFTGDSFYVHLNEGENKTDKSPLKSNTEVTKTIN